ncbi:MAG: hypothetical protein SH868_16465, partial [Bythopirellula sp.]|nr:hypothetical protein [Bythopirellula sp.]
MEPLEDRRMLATFTVSNLLDDFSTGSLRRAIFDANNNREPDEVIIAATGTILLTQGQIGIGEAITITGPGRELLSIDAQQQSRIFSIQRMTGGVADFDVSIAGLTIQNGKVGDVPFNDGGAVFFDSTGDIAFADTIVRNSSISDSFAFGGAIYAENVPPLVEKPVPPTFTISRGLLLGVNGLRIEH